MNLRTFAISDIGRVRKENEDSVLCDTTRRLYAVADGIGGLPGGAQASREAVTGIIEWYDQQPENGPFEYAKGLAEVNDRVHELGRAISPYQGIGTTLTLAHFNDDYIIVIHVGDSAMFRLRGGKLETLTVEHNLGNELKKRIARGEPAFLVTENRSALTRCVGQPAPLEGDIHQHDLQHGDRYLVCSDGITRCITPDEIGKMLKAVDTPEPLCHKLVEMANERGGVDNATAVVIFVD